MAEARRGLAEAKGGSGGALVLCGEPGIGKTRLAQEVAHLAARDEFRVLWSSCWDGGGAPALWPWIKVLRDYAASADPHTLVEVAGRSAAELARIVPGFGGAEPAAGADGSADDRFRLFDSVATLLENSSADRPICMIIDDIQWADRSSLDLLQFVGSRIAAASIFVVATRRVNEPGRGPVADTLDELAASMPTMQLHGLSVEDVARLFESVTGMTPADQLSASVHTRSGGNPLFVRELARLLAAQVDSGTQLEKPAAMPVAVQSVIERRLGLLSDDCRTLLEAAAVVGVDFDLDLACRVGGHDGAGRVIDEAVRNGLVLSPGPPSRDHRFVHGLVRDVIYGTTASEARARLHRRVAHELESTIGFHPDEMLAHYERAGEPEDLARAVDCAEAASDAAYGRFAFTEAADLARHGLQLAEALAADDRLRLRLLLRTGHALNRSGNVAQARTLFLDAAAAARDLAAADELADAALGYGYRLQSEGLGGMGLDRTLIDLLEEGIAAVPADSVPGVLLRWRLCNELLYVDSDRTMRLVDEALEGARRNGDPRALGLALETKSQASYDTATPRDRLAAGTEVFSLGRSHGLPEVEMRGHVRRVTSQLELGDIAAVDREIAATERLVSEARLQADRWYPALWRAMRTLHDGRLDEGEAQATEALMVGEAQGQGAVDHFGMQLMAIRREQGRMGEILELIHDGVETYPEIPAYRCALAMAYAETGETALAQAEMDPLAANDFALIAHDYNWSVSMMCLSAACRLLGDSHKAEVLLSRWRGHEDEGVFVGYGAFFGGAVTYFMGILASTAGRVDAAVEYLEDALTRNRAAGATLWTVRTEMALGELLADRDPERAADLLARARQTASELGLVSALAELDAVGEVRVDPDDGSPSAEENVFRRDGDMWTVVFASATAHLRDSKGMRDLAELLRCPGQEIHALQLYAGAPVPGAATSDDMIDARAAREYRARIIELQEEVEDADAMFDTTRAERARIELDTLTDTLASAFGVGGRPRRASGDPSERARKAVRARIRDSIRRIADAHPDLGTHLDQSIKTGTFLRYQPDPPARWRL